MLLFLDTANLTDIRTALSWGILAGVTTNPSLVAKEGHRDFHAFVRELAALVPGPVNAEVTAEQADGMVAQGRALAALASNVVVKVPCTWEGLTACRQLADAGIRTNVTLVFSVNQGLLAARAGAGYISPFVGRLDDIGEDGMALVRDLVALTQRHELGSRILAASLRHTRHVAAAAMAGADIGTVPFPVLRQLVSHPLTDKGLQRFMADWRALEG